MLEGLNLTKYKKKKKVHWEISLIGSNLPGVNDLCSTTLAYSFSQAILIGFATQVQDTGNADINIYKVSRKKERHR